ncbi:MAG: Eco57I restriction-modification methylase domain-containing protein [Chloroflexota bacterium]|nr:Eco57I restriction-modification methylase domain-containing protein [Chloroflexota bacterium]
MQVEIDELRPYLQAFDFPHLFVEGLGWDYYQGEPLALTVDGHEYALKPVAEKAGFAVYRCGLNADGAVPPQSVRRQIETRVAQINYEHLIVFVDAAETRQVWQWVKRESGKSLAIRELRYDKGQSGTALLQRLRGIAFTLEEEGNLGITDVTGKILQSLDVERVTKRFYDRFREELAAFQKFIDGFTAQGDRDWYASLMLNRLMFVYFIQKQGFLDGDEHYLRHRLERIQGKDGPDQFQRFYQEFLLRLFHEGLGKPEADRPEELTALIGKVPYLNGGIFDQHALERDNPGVNIPDSAFQQVFDFFDQYQWHLDDRPTGNDNEINPDVLGYIFEKYVNQKQMGAYYTKEDITGYIARNTIIPRLLEMVQAECPVAFDPGGGVWRLLQDDPDNYIYAALGHGAAWDYSPEGAARLEEPLALPDDIALGLDDPAQRTGWNKAAPPEYALPTETWRELIARRRRYEEVRGKLAAGEVQDVNDLITLNLDSERFARDVIVNSEGPELIRAFWHALTRVSVLDPACGSGAFLFAALNILEPLYSAVLQAMRGFRDDLETSRRPRSPNALSDFREALDAAGQHQSERYYILKSIIVNNLYGVDIMEEAVEICRLRLFLKLAAQLESVDEVEPLPDIDFNIQPGNTLVGFTSDASVRQAMEMTLGGQRRMLDKDDEEALKRIETAAGDIARQHRNFQQIQTEYGMRHEQLAQSKQQLRSKLLQLRGQLDGLLGKEYGVDANKSAPFQKWRTSHQPFHWFVEFHAIMRNGGFDVVIGNPPYVSTKKVRQSYTVKGLRTVGCPDIYGMVVERATELCRISGRTSMIVPLSMGFSEHFSVLREYLYQQCGHLWFSSFGRIPSALFSFDTRVRNTIYLAKRSTETAPSRMTTRLHRWFDSERVYLFDNLNYCSFTPSLFGGLVPKLGNARLVQGFEDLLSRRDYRLGSDLSPSRQGFPLHFKQTAYNWLTFCVEQPPVFGPSGAELAQTKYGTVRFVDEDDRNLSLLLTNGLVMFTWWVAIGDDFDLTRKNFSSAPFGPKQLSKQQRGRMLKTVQELAEAMSENVVYKLNAGKNIGNYNLLKCRHITDKIDKAWLHSLGLSDLWEEVELEHSLVVRTSYDDDE